MADMKYRENIGLDPVTLSKGYTKLDGDPPNSGESITAPEHIQRRNAMSEYMDECCNDADEQMGGFMGREVPEYYERRNRTTDEDRG